MHDNDIIGKELSLNTQQDTNSIKMKGFCYRACIIDIKHRHKSIISKST
jgi:hypothetical protein